MTREPLDLAEGEWRNARHLHQNFLKNREPRPRKASEFLWGAINNLLSGIHRLEERGDIGKHREVMAFAEEIVVSSSRLSEPNLDAAKSLHRNFYHDFLEDDEFDRRCEQAAALYDELDQRLGSRVAPA